MTGPLRLGPLVQGPRAQLISDPGTGASRQKTSSKSSPAGHKGSGSGGRVPGRGRLRAQGAAPLSPVCHPVGYTGPHCEVDIDECDPDPCHYGSCKDGVAAFTCLCRPGYTGHHCETNINECHSQPCHHGGTCQDRDNAYLCLCLKGTTGACLGLGRGRGWGGSGADHYVSPTPQDPTVRSTWTTVPATPATRAPVWTRLTATSVHASRATQVSGPGGQGPHRALSPRGAKAIL